MDSMFDQYNEGLLGWYILPTDKANPNLTYYRIPFSGLSRDIKESGAGQVVLLYKAVEKAIGQFPIHKQTIGDCVSHGWSLAVDVLKCVEIVIGGESESFEGETATEVTYAGSRQIAGQLGSWDGSTGAWAAKWAVEYGFLLRKIYKDGSNEEDLSTYSGQRAAKWAAQREGVPDWLEKYAKEHPVKKTALVTSYEEARDAIANGFPVPVCSNVGFSSNRDSEGFSKREGSWAHCMCFIAVDDSSNRKGLLCANSWGPDWISGPKRHDQPEGTFWVDASVCTSMLKGEDSYAISNFDGYKRQDLNYYLI